MGRKRISERVIGCALSVSNSLGTGFLEAVYENALGVEFDLQGIRYARQKQLSVIYRDKIVGTYIPDFIIEDQLIVELKALSNLNSEHESQVLNYLRVCNLSVGLLLNFGTKNIGIRRLVWRHDDTSRI